MSPELDELLELADSNDKTVRDLNIGYIAMLLEKNNVITNATYASLLPPHLLSVILNEAEQREFVEGLSKLIASGRTQASMLYAIGKASVEAGLEPLLIVIKKYSTNFDEYTGFQAILALDNFTAGGTKEEYPDIAYQLKQNNPIPFLQRFCLVRNSLFDIESHAQRVLNNVRSSYGVDGE